MRAIAAASGYATSPVAGAYYTIRTAAPTFNPLTGTYPAAQPVAISSTTVGAAIYYTTDGSTPTASSTLYSAPVTIGKTRR
ncbi:MAG TPA: chitobiase/beta-hexosaminidase C-terminal domain-containing protein [Terracidiphilus sp.]